MNFVGLWKEFLSSSRCKTCKCFIRTSARRKIWQHGRRRVYICHTIQGKTTVKGGVGGGGVAKQGKMTTNRLAGGGEREGRGRIPVETAEYQGGGKHWRCGSGEKGGKQATGRWPRELARNRAGIRAAGCPCEHALHSASPSLRLRRAGVRLHRCGICRG